jgi:hypothetical protein
MNQFVALQHKTNIMKFSPLLFLCFFLNFVSPVSVSAQVYKFKASSYSILEKDTKGKWGKWSDFKESTVVITLDGNKNRVIVASQEIQLFKILAYGQKIETEFDETITLDCEDNGGGACTIQIVTRKNQGNRKQFYINYADVKFVYNIYVSN